MPLANDLRPNSLDEVFGQQHLIGPEKPIRRMKEKDAVQSMLLWGPAGIGKTTIARCLANDTACNFKELNATNSKIADIRKLIDVAKARKKNGTDTILFVDECLSYDTLIICKIEDEVLLKMIGEVVENKLSCEVLSYNHDKQIEEWQPIQNWYVKHNKQVIEIEIELDDGSIQMLKCSADHLIYTKNRGYVKAKLLDENDELVHSSLLKDKYSCSKSM